MAEVQMENIKQEVMDNLTGGLTNTFQEMMDNRPPQRSYEEVATEHMDRVAGFKVASAEFYGAKLLGVYSADGEVLIPVKPLCEGMSLSYTGQFERIHRTPMLKRNVRMIRTVAEDGKPREMFCLNIHTVPMWLATIETSRIKDTDTRMRVELYQMEVMDVLFKYFIGSGVAVNRGRGKDGDEFDSLRQAFKEVQHQVIDKNEKLLLLAKHIVDLQEKMKDRDKYFEVMEVCPFCMQPTVDELYWENPDYGDVYDSLDPEDGSGTMVIGEVHHLVCGTCGAGLEQEWTKSVSLLHGPDPKDKGKYKNW